MEMTDSLSLHTGAAGEANNNSKTRKQQANAHCSHLQAADETVTCGVPLQHFYEWNVSVSE